MSIAKVVELIAEGGSIEEAAESALNEASKTVRNIKSIYLQDIQALVENNKVQKYRVVAKVSFIIEN